VLGSTAPLVKKAVRRWRLSGLVEPEWLQLGRTEDSDLALTAPQVADIERFLVSARLRPFLTIVAVSRLLGDGDRDLVETLRRQFGDEAERWCLDSEETWHRASDAVWSRLVEILGFALPSTERINEIALEIDAHSSFIQSSLSAAREYSLAETCVQRLLALASSLPRVRAALHLASTVSAVEREKSLPPIMSHSDIDNPSDFARLYVQRTLIDAASEAEIPSAAITGAEAPFRLVLLGNPGAGKTTFVRNLAHELSLPEAGETGGQACVIVRCREYRKPGNFRDSICEFITKMLSASGIPEVSLPAFEDALLLGQVVIVFDGLDEVTQTNQRIDLVERIETLTRTFPLASILVTSREVGYPRAPVDDRMYKHVALREFTEPQVREYAEKWFTAQGENELIDPFMRESETVVDLRRSPLLLSLLCVLYRARGSLPRRRLEVYSKCADLLFHTWDSHRQIEQPEELPRYGDRLMQEIARWVYDSQAAQEGLPERVLEKIIAGYLADAGVDKTEADRRARDFLEFCAGRAWLLGTFGTTQVGERLFGFTHRTFFEYFTAEALARRSSTVEKVCGFILAAFEKDETSVLPELLIQAYDEKQDQGGPALFKAITARQAPAGLVLRLMNGTLLSRPTRRLGFITIIEGWRADRKSIGREAVDALFTLEPNGFKQFVDEFITQRDGDAYELLSHTWASSYLLHREHNASELVTQTMTDIASDAVASDKEPDWDLAVWNWLVASGALRLPPTHSWLFLAVGSTAGTVPGAVPALLTRRLLGRKDASDEIVISLLGDWLGRLDESNEGIPQSIAAKMFEAADPVIESSPDVEHFQELTSLSTADRLVLLTLVAASLMAAELGRPADAAWLRDATALRHARLSYEDQVPPELGHRVAGQMKSMPNWARHWALGRYSFLGDNPRDLEFRMRSLSLRGSVGHPGVRESRATGWGPRRRRI
jgi:hypothetical protein